MKGFCIIYTQVISIFHLMGIYATDKCIRNGRTDCETTDSQCYTLWNKQGLKVLDQGCFDGKTDLNCTSNSVCDSGSTLAHEQIFCCCKGHLCNKELHISIHLDHIVKYERMTINKKNSDESTQGVDWTSIMCITLSGTLFIIVIIIILYLKVILPSRANVWHLGRMDIEMNVFPDTTKNEEQYDTMEYLKGTIQLEQLPIGSGSSGNVYTALYKPDYCGEEKEVAVKKFRTSQMDAWRAEYIFYNCSKVRTSKHENILKFYGVLDYSVTMDEFCLVTELHKTGTLCYYLRNNNVSWKELLNLCLGTSKGVEFLHDEVPSIVHRDIKSENILIKNDFSPCISDFGLHTNFEDKVERTQCLQVGTLRYMSPEILDCTINCLSFEDGRQYICVDRCALLATDIYSLALVFWEIMTQCPDMGGPLNDYMLPYERGLGAAPSREQMKDYVVHRRNRPQIESHWLHKRACRELCSTLSECWDHDPESRLQASTIVERLKDLQMNS